MSNTVVELANKMQTMVERLKKRQIEFTEVPFDEIVNTIQVVYEQIFKKGEEFVLLYGKQITKALEQRDYDSLADMLQIVSHHLMLIENYKGISRAIRKKESDFYKERCKKVYFNNLRKIEQREYNQGENDYIPFRGRGVVYSAITGGYDQIKEPQCINQEFDYILFTDNPNLQSQTWKIRLIDNPQKLDNVRLAKQIKILGHKYLKEYDFSIWVDGSMVIMDDLKEYINCYMRKEPMLCFNHHKNECIYDEIKDCKMLRKDNVSVMEEQILRYRKEGFPENYGVIESGVLVRDIHNKKVREVMEAWWKELENGSCRDQLSFNYICWKLNFMYDSCDLSIFENKYVRVYYHNKK